MLGLSVGQPNSVTWYELEESAEITSNSIVYSPDLLFRIIIGLEDEATQHSRSIYSALDMLGDVGGLLDGLKLIGSLVMFLFHLLCVFCY